MGGGGTATGAVLFGGESETETLLLASATSPISLPDHHPARPPRRPAAAIRPPTPMPICFHSIGLASRFHCSSPATRPTSRPSFKATPGSELPPGAGPGSACGVGFAFPSPAIGWVCRRNDAGFNGTLARSGSGSDRGLIVFEAGGEPAATTSWSAGLTCVWLTDGRADRGSTGGFGGAGSGVRPREAS